MDMMLWRLGRWLRLLGQDVASPKEASDQELLARAIRENRILVTRDKRLAEDCRRSKAACILIRTSQIEEQLAEMAKSGVPLQLDPQRCTCCNSPLQRLQSQEKATWRCVNCKKVYWEGGHWRRMRERLQAVRSRLSSEAQGSSCQGPIK